jgi:membrane protease YdiL (CAAX protease family)
MPLIWDARYMAFRLLSPLPYGIFVTALYLRVRRLLPFIIAHALMDSASVLLGAVSRSFSPG